MVVRPHASGKGRADGPAASPGAPRPWPKKVGREKVGRGWQYLIGIAVAVPLLLSVMPARTLAVNLMSKGALAAASRFAPPVANFAQVPTPSHIVASDGSELAEVTGPERRQIVTLDQVPLLVRRAVLAAEDSRFYQHPGIDASALFRAALHTAKGSPQGGSTITQQLAKLNFTGGDRSVLRKVREAEYAARLEKQYTKDQLLERYLNQVSFGQGAYGIGPASEIFFGVEPSGLTVADAATLAGKIRQPESLDPRTKPAAVTARRNAVLASMLNAGWIAPSQFDEAVAEPLSVLPPQPPKPVVAPHFVDYVKREAATLTALGPDPQSRLERLATGGLRVETTLDPVVYDASVAAVGRILGAPGDPNAATASVEPGTGAVRSLFGGLDYTATQFDVASQGGRQPGSAFKPFAYLAALLQGIDPRSTFDGSSPMQVPCYGQDPVENYGGTGAGVITLEDALANSVNVVFAQLMCEVTPDWVLDVAHKAGIPAWATTSHPSIVLGGLDIGVNAVTMAAAYATFATGGLYAQPYAIGRITDAAGRVVYDHRGTATRVFPAEDVAVLNEGLERVISSGTGVAANLGGRPVAGKTGTTEDNGDAWFIGFVPQLATAVWVGYEPRQPMQWVHGGPVTGGRYPAQIFAALMRPSLEGDPVVPIKVAGPDSLQLHMLTGPTTTEVTDPSSTTTTVMGPPATTTPTPTAVTAPPTTVPRSSPTTTTATTAPRPTTTVPRPTTTAPPTTVTSTPPTTANSNRSAQP